MRSTFGLLLLFMSKANKQTKVASGLNKKSYISMNKVALSNVVLELISSITNTSKLLNEQTGKISLLEKKLEMAKEAQQNLLKTKRDLLSKLQAHNLVIGTESEQQTMTNVTVNGQEQIMSLLTNILQQLPTSGSQSFVPITIPTSANFTDFPQQQMSTISPTSAPMSRNFF